MIDTVELVGPLVKNETIPCEATKLTTLLT